LLTSKIKSVDALSRIIYRLRKQGKTVVFTNGCFDLLHAGHIRYLEEAKTKGNILIVAVNSDASVRRIKGKKRPLVGQLDRLSIVAALASVDYACLFSEDTPIKVIRRIKPDILVKGADWKNKTIIGSEFVKSYGGNVATIKFIKNHSTSHLIKKIVKSFC
jgi:rfaE bifunctional protein nucleotidyltransferase chain/domain